MSAIEQLRAVARDPRAPAREWKAQGKKVVGYRCLYVPEEIIWAADMLALPVYGTSEPIKGADAYFQACTCEFVRNIFDHALDGELDFLDGFVVANTCDVVRRLHDLWSEYIGQVPVYFINNPQLLANESNREFYLEELRLFRAKMEEVGGVEITDDKLADGIALHNETRRLLKELTLLRRDDPSPLTGAEAVDIATAATVLPKERANALLAEALEEVKRREVEEQYGSRILLTGSVIDNPALVQMVEDEGGVVVADDLCNTMRTFWFSVDTEGDPMDALYRFQNARPLCACMHPTEVRLEYLKDLVEEFEVDGVIYFNIKYCHPFLYEAPIYKRALEAMEVPTNVLEVGHDMSGHGQLRTRVQAFIEMLEL